MIDQSRGSQFGRKRMIGFTVAFAVVIAWMFWLVENRPPIGGDGGFTSEAWEPHRLAAWLSIAFVVITDIVAIAIMLKKRRRLPEEEKDWKGPDPHLDRMIPVQSYSPSPVMQRALRRTLEKQSS